MRLTIDKKIIGALSLGAVSLLSGPLSVLAAIGDTELASNPRINDDGVLGIATLIQNVLAVVVPIVLTLAVIYFIWGLAEFILAAGDPEKKSEGKTRMIYGVIALFIIVSIWGIIGFLGNALGIGQGGSAPVPGVDVEDYFRNN